jgi:putative membrane protein
MFIVRLLVKWIALSAAVYVAALLIPGITVASIPTALLVGLILLVINMIVKPILGVLTLPINILTLGIFGFIVNVLLFWAVAYVVSGFDIASWWPAAILGSILVSVVWTIAEWIT